MRLLMPIRPHSPSPSPSAYPTTSLPEESQTEIHLNCKPTTIRPLQAVHHAPCAMCHVTCLPRLWETIAFSHRYLSYRLREQRHWTQLSWAPPWRTILYKYLRHAPLPRSTCCPARRIRSKNVIVNVIQIAVCAPLPALSCPALSCCVLPACPLLYRPCLGIMWAICMYCIRYIYTWAAKRAPKVDINNKWENESTTCPAGLLDYRICSTFHRLISVDLAWVRCGSPS